MLFIQRQKVSFFAALACGAMLVSCNTESKSANRTEKPGPSVADFSATMQQGGYVEDLKLTQTLDGKVLAGTVSQVNSPKSGFLVLKNVKTVGSQTAMGLNEVADASILFEQ